MSEESVNRTWRIVETTTRIYTVEGVSEEAALKSIVGEIESQKTERTAHWIDDMDVLHLEGCEGLHCRHYGCPEENDGVPQYCSQCDINSY